MLGKDALDYGPPPHFLPADAVDPSVATVGARDELGYFQNHLHAQVILTSGQAGSNGWFAVRSAPASWSSDADSNDASRTSSSPDRASGRPTTTATGKAC